MVVVFDKNHQTCVWEIVGELQQSSHVASCLVSQPRLREDFWIPNQLRHNYTVNIIISQQLSGVGDKNRTCFHGFAIQCLSNWLHLHNLVPRVRFELTKFLLLRETTFPICPSGHLVGWERIELSLNRLWVDCFTIKLSAQTLARHAGIEPTFVG